MELCEVHVLLGLQWGDEGKGKIVDFLADQYEVVCRFQVGGGELFGGLVAVGEGHDTEEQRGLGHCLEHFVLLDGVADGFEGAAAGCQVVVNLGGEPGAATAPW